MHQLFRITGKIAVITGGAKGIGRAIAELFAEAGAHVIIVDYDQSAGEKTIAEMSRSYKTMLSFYRLDVRDMQACRLLADHLAEKYGAADILVNNAGIVKNAPVLDVTESEWREVIDVNLNGVFYCAQAFGAHMVSAGKGAVINISSMCADIVVQPQSQAAYNAAKAGVNLITKSLAVEWAKQGIRVNAVAPGYIATELTLAGRTNEEWFSEWLERTPLARLGEPREVANAVLFLASDASSFITGTILTVDGGYTAL